MLEIIVTDTRGEIIFRGHGNDDAVIAIANLFIIQGYDMEIQHYSKER